MIKAKRTRTHTPLTHCPAYRLCHQFAPRCDLILLFTGAAPHRTAPHQLEVWKLNLTGCAILLPHFIFGNSAGFVLLRPLGTRDVTSSPDGSEILGRNGHPILLRGDEAATLGSGEITGQWSN